MGISKALTTALREREISYTMEYGEDPATGTRTAMHLFKRKTANTATVLFHGTGNDALFAWEDLILQLNQSGRTVVAFDLPGHGQNSSTELDTSLFVRLSRDVPSHIRRLLPEYARFEAIGYSLGGLAALQSAELWDNLVLLALPPAVAIGAAFVFHEARSILHPLFWKQWRRYGWDATFPAFGPVRRQRFPIRLTSDVAVSYPKLVDQLLHAVDAKAILRRRQKPTTLIYGECDALAKAEYGRTLPGAFRLVPGANHFLLPLHATTRRWIIEALTSPQRPAANSIPR